MQYWEPLDRQVTSCQLVEVKYQFKLGCLDPGLEAVKQALAGGHTVTALVRNPSKLEAVTHPNLTVVEAGDSGGVWSIKTLYPIIGVFMLLPIPAFVYYYIEEYRRELRVEDSVEAEKADNTSSSEQLSRRMRVVLMVFMALFYFTVSGVELGFRGFIAVFCVNSSLAMSRSEAADILAIFYTTFAAVRGLLVPASTLVSSTAILWSSALTLLTSTSLLAAWADSSLAVLRAGVALTGAGTAAMFAAGVLWLRGVITVDNKVR